MADPPHHDHHGEEGYEVDDVETQPIGHKQGIECLVAQRYEKTSVHLYKAADTRLTFLHREHSVNYREKHREYAEDAQWNENEQALQKQAMLFQALQMQEIWIFLGTSQLAQH